jgi:hypothetical protein
MPAFQLLEERKKERVVGDGSVPPSHLVVGVITHPQESWEMPFAEAAFVFGKHFPKRKLALDLRGCANYCNSRWQLHEDYTRTT